MLHGRQPERAAKNPIPSGDWSVNNEWRCIELNNTESKNLKRGAFYFIILLGLVSLLADVTYEGARSVTGPYLGLLGASSAVVGFAAGFGEMLGYAFRLVSGYWADRTHRYWLLTIVGYALNLLAIPLLAFVGNWQVAVLLLILETLGKGLRTPARDVMLSQATKQVGRGFGFGLHEAMDQIGAVAGPVFVSIVLAATWVTGTRSCFWAYQPFLP